jgi:hypothetical protein
MATTYVPRDNDPIGALPAPARSAASVVAILSAIISFVMSARGSEIIALVLAIVAIGAGLLGGLRALSPRVRGGILSIMAVVLGAIAIVVAAVALIV